MIRQFELRAVGAILLLGLVLQFGAAAVPGSHRLSAAERQSESPMTAIAAEIAELKRLWHSRGIDREALLNNVVRIRNSVRAAQSKPNTVSSEKSKGVAVLAAPTERKIAPSRPQDVTEAERARRYEQQFEATLETHRPDTRKATTGPPPSDSNYLEALERACASLARALAEDAPSDAIDLLVRDLP